jgi:carbohydrate-binding DOMON domain-containing protein
VDINQLRLPAEVRQRLYELYGNRINKENELASIRQQIPAHTRTHSLTNTLTNTNTNTNTKHKHKHKHKHTHTNTHTHTHAYVTRIIQGLHRAPRRLALELIYDSN